MIRKAPASRNAEGRFDAYEGYSHRTSNFGKSVPSPLRERTGRGYKPEVEARKGYLGAVADRPRSNLDKSIQVPEWAYGEVLLSLEQ